MKRPIMILCSVCLLAVNTGGQQQEKLRYVAVPPERMLLTVAAQPDSPLLVENAKLLIGVGPYPAGVSCQLRNRGTKPIRSFRIVLWSSTSAGGGLSPRERSGGRLLMPGEVMPCDEGDPDEIIPLTEQLRDKLKLRGPMKTVEVLMVESVRFADGTTYSDEATSEALVTFFENLDDSRVPKQ
jgi:hypothetical protein